MVHITYAGLPVHLPAGTLGENLAFTGPEPHRPMSFAMFAGENDTYGLAVQTLAGRPAPTDHASLLDCLTRPETIDPLLPFRCHPPRT